MNSVFLLPGEVIKYTGDPLQDFTLPKFLDRFVFKNPKKKNNEEVVINSKFSRKKTYVPSGIRALRVDSSSYLNEDESRIPVDELFMYKLVLSYCAVSFIKTFVQLSPIAVLGILLLFEDKSNYTRLGLLWK